VDVGVWWGVERVGGGGVAQLVCEDVHDRLDRGKCSWISVEGALRGGGRRSACGVVADLGRLVVRWGLGWRCGGVGLSCRQGGIRWLVVRVLWWGVGGWEAGVMGWGEWCALVEAVNIWSGGVRCTV